MTTCKASYDDVETAFISISGANEAWLDRVTGEVIFITEDIRYALKQDPATLGDWEREEVARARRVLRAIGYWGDDDLGDDDADEADDTIDRYVAIPQQDSPEGFQVMEDFVWRLNREDAGQVVDDLISALRGDKPFRRFKDALCDYPAVRERWFKFEAERLRARITEWARYEGITLA